jgi:hypothetical protein
MREIALINKRTDGRVASGRAEAAALASDEDLAANGFTPEVIAELRKEYEKMRGVPWEKAAEELAAARAAEAAALAGAAGGGAAGAGAACAAPWKKAAKKLAAETEAVAETLENAHIALFTPEVMEILRTEYENTESAAAGAGAAARAGRKKKPPKNVQMGECCLLVLDSVTSTPRWTRQPEAAWWCVCDFV